jgi:hypothetical protein
MMSRPINPVLDSGYELCLVHFFLLKNDAHLTTLRTNWSNVPNQATLNPLLSPLLDSARFRYLVEDGGCLSEPLTLSEIFGDSSKLTAISARSFVLYMHNTKTGNLYFVLQVLIHL